MTSANWRVIDCSSAINEETNILIITKQHVTNIFKLDFRDLFIYLFKSGVVILLTTSQFGFLLTVKSINQLTKGNPHVPNQ